MRFLLLVLSLSLPVTAMAEGLFDRPASAREVQALLPTSATGLTREGVLSGQFSQTKTLSDLPKPLLSSGRFLFARERGVIWQVLRPYPSEFVLTPHAMVTREGGRERVMAASEQPGLAVATRLFSALFTLDLAALEQDFLLHAAGSPEAWQLGLRPRHAAMAASFSEAVIRGGSAVKSIVLRDARGDSTEITLSDLKAENQLGREDAKRFPP